MSNIAEVPREKLKEILARTGDALLQDPDRCEGLLKDHCGPHRREISALVGALEERVPMELRSSWQTAMTPEAMRARLVQRLQDNRGLAPDVADWAVDAWSYALGVGLGRRSERLESHVISGGPPVVPVIPVPAPGIPTRPDMPVNSAYVREFGAPPPPQQAQVIPPPPAPAGWSTQKKAAAGAAAAALAFVIWYSTPKPGPDKQLKTCPTGQILAANGNCEVPPPPPKPPEPVVTTPIAVGTSIPVSVGEALNSDTVMVGQYIKGTIKTPIDLNGKTVIPAGTAAVLQVKAIDQAGKLTGAAKIELALVEVNIDGKKYTVASAVTDVKGPSKTVNTAKKTGIFGAIGTGIGCGVGHVTGHTGAGCAAGAGGGAATGVAVAAHDKPKPAELKAGTILKFKLSEPMNVG